MWCWPWSRLSNWRHWTSDVATPKRIAFMNQLIASFAVCCLRPASRWNRMSLSKPSNRSSTPSLFLIAFLCGCVLWSIDTLAQQPGSKLWEFGAGDSEITQPAIDEYGNLFFGSGSSGRFYALDSTGSELWEYQTGGQVVAPASLGPDGTVYFSSTDQKLYAFTPTGRRKWTFAPGGYPSGAPAVGVDGTIYVGFGSTLYSLNPDSAVNWQFSVSSTLGAGGVAIGADGTIYFGSWDQHVYALSPAGTNKWNYSDNFPANGPPALDTNGNVYVGFDSGSIQVLNPQGTRIWGYSTRSEEHTSELQSHSDLVCRLLLEKKKNKRRKH